jgi:hypothetical protein
MSAVMGALIVVEMGVAADAFRDQGDQAKLEKRSPPEWPEKEIPGSLNRKRNRIRS